MTHPDTFDLRAHIRLTTDVVCSYVARNHVAPSELPALMTSVHEAFHALATGAPSSSVAEAVEKPNSAQIRKSNTPDALISFIDGKSYKTLKRHLTKHGLDPRSYRERFGLPSDYPMTAASYSERRSALAKNLGLGQKQTAEEEASPPPAKARRRAQAAAR